MHSAGASHLKWPVVHLVDNSPWQPDHCPEAQSEWGGDKQIKVMKQEMLDEFPGQAHGDVDSHCPWQVAGRAVVKIQVCVGT